MAAHFLATSVNIVNHSSDDSNTQNARIHYDTDATKGWKVGTDGTLTDGTELRRSVLDPTDKTAATDAKNSSVGITYEYDSAQMRTVKKKVGSTAAIMVFAPAHL